MTPVELPTVKARVLFDATRLVARAGFATPTGIDRVDLAYVGALGAAENLDLRLVVFDRLGPHLLGPRSARRLIDTVTRRWRPSRGAAAEPHSPFERLRAFLEAPAGIERPAALSAAPPSANGHRLQRLLLTLGRAEGALALRRLSSARGSLPLVYVNTSHGHLFRAAAARWLQATGIASVFTIHDLIPIEYPEFSRFSEPARHAARLRTVAVHAHRVLVDTEAIGTVLERYLRTSGQRIPAIDAVPLGIDDSFGCGPDIALRPARPYFVAVSTIEPRKNHQMLLQIWRRLVESEGDAAPRLVLIGRRGWENQTVFNILDRASLLSQHVVECAGFSDSEIVALIRHSRALLAPSFSEGYGLPVAEALALGTPVIASDIAPHREVGGSCAEYLDPLDGLGWLQAIREYAVDPSFRRTRQSDHLSSFQRPRWETHFKIALRLIEESALAGQG